MTSSPPPPEPDSAPAAPPLWVVWLMLGLTAMLAVLFGVTLERTLGLRRSLVRIDERLQRLEKSDVLERANVLEPQMRAMLERLRQLEDRAARIEELEADRSRLERELEQLRSRSPHRDPAGLPGPAFPTLPPEPPPPPPADPVPAPPPGQPAF
jgi:hypothetical protein